jgi:hypothetical protein
MSTIEPRILAKWAKVFDALPGIDKAQSKLQWKAFRKVATEMQREGFRPPHGEWDEIHTATVGHLNKHPKR